jgi:tetratricopeptide (TPR) repeat protein/methylmalonyl-CoA mutase cobalamin-binding subunit
MRIPTHDVFLSYAHADRSAAELLASELRNVGLDVWTDALLQSGSSVVDAVNAAIESARAVVVLISPSSASSSWHRREVEAVVHAADGGLRLLIPVLIGGVDRRDLPAMLRQFSGLMASTFEFDRVAQEVRAAIPADSGLSVYSPQIPQGRPWVYLTAEVAAAESALATGSVWIVGAPGSGKTTAAVSICRNLAEQYRIVWWVSGRSRDAILADLSDLAVALDRANHSVDRQLDARSAMDFLAATTEPWLVVIDDLEIMAHVDDVVPRSTPSGRILITSRRGPSDHRLWLGSESTVVTLRSFSSGESMELLRSLSEAAGQPMPNSVAGELAAISQGSPLLLTLLGHRFLNDPDDADGGTERFLDGLRGPGSTLGFTIRSAILDATRGDPLTGSVLDVLAAADPSPLDVEVLLKAVGEVTGAHPPAVRSAISRLAARGLLIETDGYLVLIHLAVHEAIADRYADAAGRALINGLATSDISIDHLIRHGLTAVTRRPQAVEPSDVMNLRTVVEAIVSEEAGDIRVRVELVERALQTVEEVLGPRHPEALTLAASLGSLCWEMGRTSEAISIFERLLADSVEVLGEQHPSTLNARANLAHSYRSAGRTREAIALEERVLADSIEILGDRHPSTLTAKSNLGSSYWAAGRTSEAISIFERLLADSVEVLGEQHPSTLNARANLAASYSSLGRIPEAISMQEGVLRDRIVVSGERDRETLQALSNLATSYRSSGRLDDAIAMERRVLLDSIEVLGAEHPTTLVARGNLASSCLAAGYLDESTKLLEGLADDCARVLGSRHPDVLTTKANLASSYLRMGRVHQAIALFEVLLSDSSEVLGSGHPNTLVTKANLAAAYRQTGQFASAVELLRQTAEESSDVLGSDHPSTVALRERLEAWREFGEAD